VGHLGLSLSCTGTRNPNTTRMNQYIKLLETIKGESTEFTALAHLAGEPLMSWLKDNFNKEEPAELTVDVPHHFLDELATVAEEPEQFDKMLCQLGIRDIPFVDQWFGEYELEWARCSQELVEAEQDQSILRRRL
jgi:hypothetical protein